LKNIQIEIKEGLYGYKHKESGVGEMKNLLKKFSEEL